MKQIKSNKRIYLGTLNKNKIQDSKNQLSLHFKMPIHHNEDWEKASMVSNFFADYHTSSIQTKKNEIKSTLSTIINELIENAIKHSYKNHNEINIYSKKFNNKILILAENIAPKNKTEKLIHTINRCNESNHESHESIVINRLKHTIINNQKSSEIGLLNIIHNYKTELGAFITPLESVPSFKIEIAICLDYK